jgi:hypothetical protein
MKKLVFLLFIIISIPAHSEKLIGGEITCRNLNSLMYETTLTIYRDTISGNLPISYTITYRDSVDTIIASHVISISNGSKQWYGFTAYTYIDTITFPNAGSFKVSSWDCCRDSVDNIINSTSAGMYLECMILADGVNSSPKFLSEPITLAQLNLPFTNNITPYDVDRDSLSWELAIPEDLVSNGSGGFNIVTLPYNYPPSDTSLPFHLDSILGDISFKPNLAGKYQIAVKLIEWRNGAQIGYVKRDICLKLIQSANVKAKARGLFTIYPNLIYIPWNQGTPTPTIYIEATQNFLFHLESYDSTNFIGPYVYDYSFIYPNTIPHSSGGVTGVFFCDVFFNFYPTINDVSSNPYFITFRVEDQFNNNNYIFLNDYTFRIFVTNTTTGINEINNDGKSVYLKSIDMLGRETNPNLPGFRIDLYSDGKTKKVFRGE